MISCILCTAREDYPILGLPKVHVFEPTIRSLVKQSFKDFELIIVDALYDKRSNHDFSKLPFPVKHVPPHPNHSFWLKKGLWNVAGMLNTALLHAEGDLIVRLDDCCEIPDKDYLKKFWEYYESGLFALAMHTRYRAGRQAYYNEEYRKYGYDFQREEPIRRKILDQFYREGDPIRDTRWPTVEKKGKMIAYPEWFYGYSSFSLEAALRVNGFNELFDGVKGQEDQDFGIRLDMAGYKDVFILDKDLWVIEHEHKPCVVKCPEPFKCNYGLIQYERAKGLYRANSWVLTRENCEWIRQNICRKCLNYHRCLHERLNGRFYIDEDLFREWLNNQNVFDLRAERLEV